MALNKYKEASLIIDDYLSKHKDDTDFLKLKEAIPDNIVLNTSSNTSSNNLTPSTTPSNDLEYCQQKWWKLFASRWRTTDWTVICWCKEGYSNNVAGPGVVCEPFADKSKECAISFWDNSKSDGVKCVCKNWYTMSSDWTYCQWPGWETLLEQCQSKWGIHSIVWTTDKKCYCADWYTYSITTSQCDEPFTK